MHLKKVVLHTAFLEVLAAFYSSLLQLHFRQAQLDKTEGVSFDKLSLTIAFFSKQFTSISETRLRQAQPDNRLSSKQFISSAETSFDKLSLTKQRVSASTSSA